LKVNYQGGTGFLTETQRIQILLHLKDKPHCSVEELRDYIEAQFGIVYQSKQSYYDLLKAGGLSWHQTKRSTPNGIKRKCCAPGRDQHQTGGASGGHRVWRSHCFAEDECHLLAGDTIGHVWGRCNERTEVRFKTANNDRPTMAS